MLFCVLYSFYSRTILEDVKSINRQKTPLVNWKSFFLKESPGDATGVKVGAPLLRYYLVIHDPVPCGAAPVLTISSRATTRVYFYFAYWEG